MKPEKISRFIFMGDSLSDRGTLAKRYLLGFIPMDLFSGLRNRSPLGRFTNGLAWSDHIAATLMNKFIINDAHQKGLLDSCDIADAVINDDQRIRKLRKFSYFLDNDLYIKYKGRDFARNYSEGGLSAHDYGWLPSTNFTRFVERIILSNLDEMRAKLIAYDKENKISKAYKAETLIIEWSGGNDLITMNEHPSFSEVDKAIAARRNNIEQLVNMDYRHFILINLPDLSLTPRYQALDAKQRENAHRCSVYFNARLEKMVTDLRILHPWCSFAIFDVDTIFTNVYDTPELYGFEKEKRNAPYVTSVDFILKPNGTSPASGYMFWDDIHPSADLQGLIGHYFYHEFNPVYNFSTPDPHSAPLTAINISDEELCASFMKKYKEKFNRSNQFFSAKRESEATLKKLNLMDILFYALKEPDSQIRQIVNELGWLDEKGEPRLNIPVLEDYVASIKQGMKAVMI